ncbi:hypothetical protein [Micromonospora noduli]|uniref:hypothetical protein n=1 Tax=Micromonospora noduli TaxID=709876 RepID=UPI000DD74561|nr:hypothetical protein [Micromonospora noduli]
MFDFGIDGYQPRWLNGEDSVARHHGGRLARLVGRTLRSPWVVWEAEHDEWFADCPVVLDFAGERLEVNHQKFDDLSITWNSVDVTRPPVWSTSDDFRLVWRDDAPAVLAALRGQRLEAVELLEWAGGDLADGSVAVGLRFSDGWLALYNPLDENGIAFGQLEPEYRRHRLG